MREREANLASDTMLDNEQLALLRAHDQYIYRCAKVQKSPLFNEDEHNKLYTSNSFKFYNLPPATCLSLMSPSFIICDGRESSSASNISERINQSEIAEVRKNDNAGVFSSLADLVIVNRPNLSCLKHVKHVPAIKKITITNCKNLVSVPAEISVDLSCLEELTMQRCPKIYSQGLVANAKHQNQTRLSQENH